MPFPFDPARIPEFIFSFAIVRDFWPFWFFIVLFFAAKSVWLSYIQAYFKKTEFDYVLLELNVPREVRKSPRAMEQVFMSIHSMRNSPSNIKEKWWDGEITMWFSMEIVSFGGEIHFYMWVPRKHRNGIEAALYAQYTDVEVTEVKDDYIYRLPPTFDDLQKQGYQLFGNELRLAKSDAYPIRTYVEFEAPVEERELDCISACLELLSRIDPREVIWIQVLIRPTVDDSWKVESEKFLDELLKEMRKRRGVDEKVMGTEKTMTSYLLTPGDREIVEAIERNISKPGFETLIRYVYAAPKEIYSDGLPRRGVFGAFNQYASENLNKFAHNVKAWTRTNFWYWPHLFPGSRQRARQRRIYRYYRERMMYPEMVSPLAGRLARMQFFDWNFGAQKMGRMVLNTEELATIYHLPTTQVLTGPLIKRVEARKIGPPAGLPIYGEEK